MHEKKTQEIMFTFEFDHFDIHQVNTCKSCFHSNFIIVTDFHSFTVNENKLQN